MLYELGDIGPRRANHMAMLHMLEYSTARHRVVIWNCANGIPRWIRQARYDVIVLDATLLTIRTWSNFGDRRPWYDWIAESPAVKLAMPQDEYLYTSVLEEWMRDLDVRVVFSAFGQQRSHLLYPSLARTVSFEQSFPAYVDAALLARSTRRALRPHADRPIDVVYRARRAPYSLGSAAQLKERVGLAGRAAATDLGLRCDIEVGDHATIFGGRWLDFIESSRAVLGCESGASAIDARGELTRAESALREARPMLSFEEFAEEMPPGWDTTPLVTIGPRHLEAAALRTCQVLVEGTYDDVLEPDVHYIPIGRDLADIGSALERLGSTTETERIAARTYADVIESGHYAYGALTARVERALMPHLNPRGGRHRPSPWRVRRGMAVLHDRTVVRVPRWLYRVLDRKARGLLNLLLNARGRLRRDR